LRLIRGSSQKKKQFVGIEERQTHLDTTSDGVESWEGEGGEEAMPLCDLSTDFPTALSPLNFSEAYKIPREP